jgi:hypothetical protein
MLAATAGILIVPSSGLLVTNLTLLVIPAMAAALLGNFVSYPLTLLAAVIIGIGQSEISNYVSQPGLSDALPFILIIVVLVLRGRSLPLRSQVLDRLPRLGTGVPKPKALVFFAALVTQRVLHLLPGEPDRRRHRPASGTPRGPSPAQASSRAASGRSSWTSSAASASGSC